MMKYINKIVLMICLVFAGSLHASAQIKLEDIPFNLDDILGKSKIIKIKKGFNPVFSLGNYQINKVGILGEKLKGVGILGDILQKKGLGDVMKFYKTYKTGLVVYKVLATGGTVLSAYSAIRGLADEKFDGKDVRRVLMPALGSIATGVLTKVLTKAASYKAVDIFNGAVKKKITDILSVRPASSTMGMGVYVKL